MALDNNIDELQIEIYTESEKAVEGLDSLHTTLTRLERVAKGGAGLNGVVEPLRDLTSSLGKAVTSGMRSLMRFADVAGDWFKESADYAEAMNLFEVSLGDASDAALDYAETVQDLLGVDIQDWVEAQGSFNQLLEGYGIVDEKAAQMSKQLTQLGYDLSSLWNVDVDIAMKRLQSGMSGQIKGLKTWGINLSVAQLRETALAHGIEMSTAKMTEAQKAMLRYVTLMEKTTNVQGDLARTIITPSNALRIFGQQVTQLRRALGDIVSVLVARFIPVFQAIVVVVTKAARAIANFLGYELPEIDYSGIQVGADASEEMADGLSNAASAAKKLKSYTMGFDELNVIDPNSGSAGGGSTPMGGGFASDFGFDPSKFEYDFLGGITKDTKELEEKLMSILKIVGAIAAGLMGWKIASGVLSFFGMLQWLVKNGVIASLAAGLKILGGSAAAAAGGFWTFVNAWDAWHNGLDYDNLNGMLLGTTALVAGLGLAFGPVGAAVGAVVGSIALFATGLKDLMENGLNDKNLASFTAVGAAIGAIGIAFGPIPALVAGAVVAVTGFALALSSDAVPAIEIFDETISDTTRRKVEPFIEKIRALDDTLATLEYTGQIITDTAVADVQAQLDTIVKSITDELDADRNQALATLAPLKAALGEEAYNQLLLDNASYYEQVTAKVTEGEARINEIMATAKAEGRSITEAEWTEINRIQSEMQDAGVQHLSETEIEYQTIMNRLKDSTVRISLEQASEVIKNANASKDEAIAAAHTQYTTVELEAQRMLNVGAINDQQYQAIINAAALTRDQTIADAETQYQTILDTTTTKLGETASYIDTTTGEIKSKWQVFCDNTAAYWSQKWTDIGNAWNTFKTNFGTAFEQFKTDFTTKWNTLWTNVQQKWSDWRTAFSEGWDQFKTEFKRGWYGFWTGIGNFFIGIWNGILGGLETAINWCIDALNSLISKANSVLAFFGMEGFDYITPVTIERVPLLEVPAFAEGGFPEQGQFFLAREDGAELVGQIGRKTAVANNDQIVSGITNGVREGNGDLITAIFTIASQLVQAIEDNSSDVVIGDDEIGRANERYNRKRGVRVNSGSFAEAY